MASLHKLPGRSPYWYVAYTSAGGRRILKSTKLTDRRKATEVMLNLERAEREAASSRLNETRVRELLSDTLERINGCGLQQMTVRSWFTKWWDQKDGEGSLAETSRVAYKAAVRLFLQHLGKRADEDLVQLDADDIQKFKQARIADGLSAKTVDRDLKVIRAVLKQAHLHGHINRDPSQLVALVSKQSKRNVQTVTRETFSGAELDAILAAASGEWLTAIMLARYIGARQGDCVCMAWDNVDLQEKVLRYTDSKRHKNYVVPLHPRLEKHLRAMVVSKGQDGALCPTLSRKSPGGKYGLSMEFRRIMARAGIDDRSVVTKAVRAGSGRIRHLARRSFHSLRHSYNSELANTGASQEIRRKLVGHANNSVNDIYTHLDVAVFRKAINRLG